MSDIDFALLRKLSAVTAPDCPPLETIGKFLDEQLTDQTESAVDDHLRQCPSCTNRLIDLRELKRFTTGTDLPADLLARTKLLVKKDLRVQHRQSPLDRVSVWIRDWLRGGIPQFAALAATAIAVFYAATFYLNRDHRSELPATLRAAALPLSALTLHRDDASFLKRVASAIEALPRTLILEQTRGATNVQVYKRAAPATVLIVTDLGTGSGVLMDARGTILTNWHVVEGAKQVAVVFKPMQGIAVREDLATAATIIRTDSRSDLALLHVSSQPNYATPLRLGDSTSLEVGQDVHAIGHPDGQVWTYTSGTISQLRPDYQWTAEGEHVEHRAAVIQMQTAINPGNSGGPLLNDNAALVGINAFRAKGEGLNYAIAVDTVQSFLNASRSNAGTTSPTPQVSPNRTERFGAQISGVYLSASSDLPDLWLVYRDTSTTDVLYGAVHSDKRTTIDTIVAPRDGALAYYYDLDCDGGIDLVGSGTAEGDAASGYSAPREPLRLRQLAPEIFAAVRTGVIPASKIRLCGTNE